MTPISEAEAVVMEVLWQQAPRSADDVVAALAHRDWAEPTIKTHMGHVLAKLGMRDRLQVAVWAHRSGIAR